MHVLVGDRWEDGFLDDHREAGAVRVRVRRLATLERLDDLYFVREASLRTVWNYLREVGPLWVARKILARRGESSRNEKFASIGAGVVVEADPGSRYRPGDEVAFVAPCHPRAFERVALPEALVVPFSSRIEDEAAVILAAEGAARPSGALAEVFGWSPRSGIALREAALAEAVAASADVLGGSAGARRLPLAAPSAVRERDPAPAPASAGGRPTAVLLGYGNYGKAVVLHGVAGALDVRCVHELDPTLMPPGRKPTVRWDSAGRVREDERYDVHLIAAYHDDHAPLAIDALRAGATAVVEKPIATERAQLDALLRVLEETGGRLVVGFHKRYAPFNAWARADLGVPEGTPVHYHAVVFEEPLPARHWYRWPAAKSRIVSNGCHWLDHFLSLNAWSQPVSVDVARGGLDGEAANVSVRLDNGAFFTMLLTDVGSSRVGVRDHVELRAGGVTVTIEDGGRYRAEDRRRILRRRTVNRMGSYETMYRTIAGRIARGEPGDSLRSVSVSGALALAVEEAYASASARASRVAR
jgi:predicted dehydrogenase